MLNPLHVVDNVFDLFQLEIKQDHPSPSCQIIIPFLLLILPLKRSSFLKWKPSQFKHWLPWYNISFWILILLHIVTTSFWNLGKSVDLSYQITQSDWFLILWHVKSIFSISKICCPITKSVVIKGTLFIDTYTNHQLIDLSLNWIYRFNETLPGSLKCLKRVCIRSPFWQICFDNSLDI